MSERIAEFDSSDDALYFAKMKNRLCGSDDFEVCGGIHKPFAVMPRIQYATHLGDPFSPPEGRALPYRDGDDDE